MYKDMLVQHKVVQYGVKHFDGVSVFVTRASSSSLLNACCAFMPLSYSPSLHCLKPCFETSLDSLDLFSRVYFGLKTSCIMICGSLGVPFEIDCLVFVPPLPVEKIVFFSLLIALSSSLLVMVFDQPL